MKHHLSFSEINLFLQDKRKYYLQYILGIKEPANEAMHLGTILHKTIQDKKFNFEKAIKKAGLTSDKLRIAKLVKQIEIPDCDFELKLECEFNEGFSFLGYLDGFDSQSIYEIKTGGSFWNQQMADESLQITAYIALAQKTYNKNYPINLLTINTGNGKSKLFTTTRTQKQINEFWELVLSVYHKLNKLNWWEVRI